MGRTISTATELLRRERAEWKPFRKQISKKDRPFFDDMFDLAHIFNYAQMMAMPEHPVPIHPIFMSMVFYHCKQLSKIMQAVTTEPPT